jgi:hypothetical protein
MQVKYIGAHSVTWRRQYCLMRSSNWCTTRQGFVVERSATINAFAGCV